MTPELFLKLVEKSINSVLADKSRKLNKELEGERAAAQERPTRHLSFLRQQYPQQFAELEARGSEQAQFAKEEINLQKNKQIKEKRKIYSKLQKHSQNIKNLNAIRQDLTEKHNVEKANRQTTKTDYLNTVIDLAKEKGRVKKANLARGEILKKSLELKNDLTNAQKQNQILQNKIQQVEQQRDNYKSQLENHTCPTCSEVCCKNGDYATIKQQLDQQKENCKTHLAEKEKQIISQIITECQLGLNPDSVLEAVVTRIKELINKGPDSQVVDDLQQQLKEKDQIIADLSKPSEEIKQQLVKLSQALGLSDQVQQSLQSATNYSELVRVLSGQVEIINQEGEIVSKQTVNAKIWQIPLSRRNISLANRYYSFNKHQNTHKTKTKGEVEGSDQKPHPQKKTGRARSGSRYNPQNRGGGI
ncbi:4619_t:CDS:2, partial [Cetraspora pellucida]